MEQPGGDFDGPFVDVIMNMLGILIILSSLALAVRIVSEPTTHRTVTQSRSSLPTIQIRRFEHFRPHSEHFVIYEGRIVELDMAKLSNLATSHTPRGAISVGDAKVRIFDRDNAEWDLDSMRLEIKGRLPQELVARTWPLDEEGLELFSSNLKGAKGRRSPYFFVAETQIDGFVTVHRILEEAGLSFRWEVLGASTPIRIIRQHWIYEANDYFF